MPERIRVRPGGAADLDCIARLQAAAPEASQWDPSDYLSYRLLVAEGDQGAQGFVVWRDVGEGEGEILNLVVAPEARRRGVGGCLVRAILEDSPEALFLEVRSSNSAALNFYKSLGFEAVGERPEYYYDPPESAVVMKTLSCYRQGRR